MKNANRQLYNKVHASVTNLAKNQSGYYLISLFVFGNYCTRHIKNLPLLPLPFENNGHNHKIHLLIEVQ